MFPYKFSHLGHAGLQGWVDYSSLSCKIYGFHTTVSTQSASQTYHSNHSTFYSPMVPHKSQHTLEAGPGHQAAKQIGVSSPSAFATAAWGTAGKHCLAPVSLEDGESRKRYKASPNKKELWRGRLCEGSAVEVRWGKDWWNAHVVQVRPSFCILLHSLFDVSLTCVRNFSFSSILN